MARGSSQIGHSHSFQIKVPPGNSLEDLTLEGVVCRWAHSGGGHREARHLSPAPGTPGQQPREEASAPAPPSDKGPPWEVGNPWLQTPQGLQAPRPPGLSSLHFASMSVLTHPCPISRRLPSQSPPGPSFSASQSCVCFCLCPFLSQLSILLCILRPLALVSLSLSVSLPSHEEQRWSGA